MEIHSLAVWRTAALSRYGSTESRLILLQTMIADRSAPFCLGTLETPSVAVGVFSCQCCFTYVLMFVFFSSFLQTLQLLTITAITCTLEITKKDETVIRVREVKTGKGRKETN